MKTRGKIGTIFGTMLFVIGFGSAISMVEGNESNIRLAGIFQAEMKSSSGQKSWDVSRSEIIAMVAKDQVQTYADLYRAAAVLLKSDDLQDLLFSHDLALAALVDGFRPAGRLVDQAQNKLMAVLNGGSGTPLAARTHEKELSSPSAISRQMVWTAPEVVAPTASLGGRRLIARSPN